MHEDEKVQAPVPENPYHLPQRQGGRRRIFPSHHGNFENLEELQDILASDAWPEVATGVTTLDLRHQTEILDKNPLPHALVSSRASKKSYEFIKLAEDSYLVVIRSVS